MKCTYLVLPLNCSGYAEPPAPGPAAPPHSAPPLPPGLDAIAKLEGSSRPDQTSLAVSDTESEHFDTVGKSHNFS